MTSYAIALCQYLIKGGILTFYCHNIIIILIIKKQKRVSQTFKVRNSFDNDGIENQRALRASSFMLWLKFVLISWT